MKYEREAGRALRPGAVYAAVINGNFSPKGSANSSHGKIEDAAFLREGRYLDPVDALVQAINHGFEGAFLGLRDMENEMENSITGLERTGPMALDRAEGSTGLRFMNRLRPGGCG
jgi:hypothetical protein